MSDKAEIREAGYVEGSRMAWLLMMQTCMTNLGHGHELSQAGFSIREEQETRHQLAELCAEIGIDYDDEGYIPDIIDNVRDWANGPTVLSIDEEWQPTPENIAALPGSLREYIVRLQDHLDCGNDLKDM